MCCKNGSVSYIFLDFGAFRRRVFWEMKFLCVCNFFPVVTAMSLASPLWHSSSGGIFHFTTKFSLEVHLFLNFQAESATAALNCSGVILGSLPIR